MIDDGHLMVEVQRVVPFDRVRSQARIGLHERPSLELSHPCMAETERSRVMVI